MAASEGCNSATANAGCTRSQNHVHLLPRLAKHAGRIKTLPGESKRREGEGGEGWVRPKGGVRIMNAGFFQTEETRLNRGTGGPVGSVPTLPTTAAHFLSTRWPGAQQLYSFPWVSGRSSWDGGGRLGHRAGRWSSSKIMQTGKDWPQEDGLNACVCLCVWGEVKVRVSRWEDGMIRGNVLMAGGGLSSKNRNVLLATTTSQHHKRQGNCV